MNRPFASSTMNRLRIPAFRHAVKLGATTLELDCGPEHPLVTPERK